MNEIGDLFLSIHCDSFSNKSVYGYLAISGNFDVNYNWDSCSINTKAKIGANNGNKLEKDQLINIFQNFPLW